MTESSQPPFSPAAFDVMSALVLQSSTLDELAEHSRQSPAALQATLRLLTEGGYAAEAVGADQSAPAYRVTEKGRSAFSEQIDWLKRRITEHE